MNKDNVIKITNNHKWTVDDPRWIKVEERLPENGQKVIACFLVGSMHQKQTIEISIFHKMTTRDVFTGSVDWKYVTHWMPLPELPGKEVELV